MAVPSPVAATRIQTIASVPEAAAAPAPSEDAAAEADFAAALEANVPRRKGGGDGRTSERPSNFGAEATPTSAPTAPAGVSEGARRREAERAASFAAVSLLLQGLAAPTPALPPTPFSSGTPAGASDADLTSAAVASAAPQGDVLAADASSPHLANTPFGAPSSAPRGALLPTTPGPRADQSRSAPSDDVAPSPPNAVTTTTEGVRRDVLATPPRREDPSAKSVAATPAPETVGDAPSVVTAVVADTAEVVAAGAPSAAATVAPATDAATTPASSPLDRAAYAPHRGNRRREASAPEAATPADLPATSVASDDAVVASTLAGGSEPVEGAAPAPSDPARPASAERPAATGRRHAPHGDAAAPAEQKTSRAPSLEGAAKESVAPQTVRGPAVARGGRDAKPLAAEGAERAVATPRFDDVRADAPAAPTTAPAATPSVVDPAEIADAWRAGARSVTLRLDPPELGRVVVRLTERGGEVSATFVADRVEGAAALARERDLLERHLRDHGVAVQSLDVRASADDGGARREAAASFAERRDDAPAAPVRPRVAAAKVAAAFSPSRPVAGAGALDRWI